MNSFSKKWGLFCIFAGIFVIPFFFLGYLPTLFLVFNILVTNNVGQAIEFGYSLLSAQSAFATSLGIVLGFSGVIIFYQLRRYDLFLLEIQRTKSTAVQQVWDREAKEILNRALEGKSIAPPDLTTESFYNWSHGFMLEMRDRFVVFGRTYIAWCVFVLLFAASVIELLVFPSVFDISPTLTVPNPMIYGIMVGHVCTLLLTFSVLIGFFVLITTAMTEEKPAVDVINFLLSKVREKLQVTE